MILGVIAVWAPYNSRECHSQRLKVYAVAGIYKIVWIHCLNYLFSQFFHCDIEIKTYSMCLEEIKCSWLWIHRKYDYIKFRTHFLLL